MSREQDIADDKAFFRNVYIFLGLVIIVFALTLIIINDDETKFQEKFQSWNCEKLKSELLNDYSQYREQLILKKLHTENCYK